MALAAVHERRRIAQLLGGIAQLLDRPVGKTLRLPDSPYSQKVQVPFDQLVISTPFCSSEKKNTWISL
jgi:hypothetical protein